MSIKKVKIAAGALEPFKITKGGIPVRSILIENIKKIILEWVGKGPKVGDKCQIEIVEKEGD